MRRFLRVLLIVSLGFIFIFATAILVVFSTPSKIEFDSKKLIKSSDFIDFYDDNNLPVFAKSGKNFMEKEEFSSLVKNAFIAVEDKNFYRHKGVDIKRICKAALVNLKSFSFKQGASTISQQLIKNTHLGSEKTLQRKITEIKLTKILEKNYSKDQIITMYLNTIYFGENAFGISKASKKYFDVTPNDLTVSQAATLAGIISAPSKLNPRVNLDGCLKKRNVVINKMAKQGYITEQEKEAALNEKILLSEAQTDVKKPYIDACLKELDDIKGLSPYILKDCKILTYYNPLLQEQLLNNENSYDYQAIVIDNQKHAVSAYYSTVGEIQREIASCAKPLYVYAPAIEENFITEYTKIVDERVDFNGYAPKNYCNKYYGEVSVKEALIKSLNTPSVKILDSISVKTAKKYAEKLGVSVKNEGLSLALGNTGSGIKLKDLAAAYKTFANNGEYSPARFIKKIITKNGKTIYTQKEESEEVFSPSTASTITRMLIECSKSGTAKKLSYLPFDVAAKTGTNGNSNGNTDCFSVGYTVNHTAAVWIGSKNNDALPLEQTGANVPTYVLGKIFESLYKNNQPKPFKFSGLKQVYVDKISYEKRGELLLADENTPENYKEKLFLKEDFPLSASERFTKLCDFDVDIRITDNVVKFDFDIPEYVTVNLYKISNGKKTSILGDFCHFEDNIANIGTYEYYAIYKLNGLKTVESPPVKLKSVNISDIDGNSDKIPHDWWRDN